ncbi:tRNA uracil 4-sulfurtransferase ThiI [Ammoniphilus sp. CFH 90114]|uniref:tRNA uracil 4-sulfurtransferase ThiI n=1 Tax=Ammoniphilus sp. CFH 90114 TaxID=2493665 RepID=UPI00100DD7BE|nr:tRNA uracil 4-sulfurtransferase ThiI [Ammoniphilus sp. CFH 90114]RXT13537.1 tRNA 4-thiouridine(8) synthase ThiI [Ammoniphilus sp. CFH 90114]
MVNYDDILIRYGEMALKGKNRGMFEKQLITNLKRSLKDFPDIEIENTYGRMYISLNGAPYSEVEPKVKKIFGITSFSPTKRIDSFELETIKEAALSVMQDVSPQPRTFKVETNRSNKRFPHRSMEMNNFIGGYVLKNMPGLKVDVRQPEVLLKVEIRNEGTFINCLDVPANGGLPVGTSGKAMLLLSGGIDSPVAGWMTMKRGVRLEGIHFESPPFTSERARQKVLDLAGIVSQYGAGEMRVHMVPFTKIQTEIRQKCPEHYLITIMRRFMMRIAERIAHKRKALAIATGESLGQVASQTMESMYTINNVTKMPILRPLVAMDKADIIRIAHQIGTYETSILPFEDCCTIFVPKSPVTRPNVEKAEKFEQKLDIEGLVEEAVRNTEIVVASAIQKQEESLDLF